VLIQVANHGPLVLSTNYWTSDLAREGKVWCSVNAGAIRVLLPPDRYGDLSAMRTGKYCVLSRGPWTPGIVTAGQFICAIHDAPEDGVEILFDDGSEAPYVLMLTAASFDVLPAEPAVGREWLCSVWVARDGKPHKSLERICHWRRVERIPCLLPWNPHA